MKYRIGKVKYEEDVTSPGRWVTVQGTGFYDVHTEQQLLQLGAVPEETKEECGCVCHDPFPEKGVTFTHSIGQCKCQQTKPLPEIEWDESSWFIANTQNGSIDMTYDFKMWVKRVTNQLNANTKAIEEMKGK